MSMFKQSAQAAGLLPASSAVNVPGTSLRDQIAIQKVEEASKQAAIQQQAANQQAANKQLGASRVTVPPKASPQPSIPLPPSQPPSLPPSLGTPIIRDNSVMAMPNVAPSPPMSAPQYTLPAYSAPMPESPPVYPTEPVYPTYRDSGIMPNVPTGSGAGPNPFTFPMDDDRPALTKAKASKAIVKVDDTPAAAAKKSLWERILAFFGLSKVTKPSFTGESFEQEIAELVQRSRAGDQNATAMICLITKNAEKGNPKAIRSAKAIDRYIEKHPMPEPLFGFEGPIVSCISHGPYTQCATFGEEDAYMFGLELSKLNIIPNVNIRRYLAQFGDEGKRDFAYGFMNAERITSSDSNYNKPLVQTGKAIGIARRIQANRMGIVKSAQESWDIGE